MNKKLVFLPAAWANNLIRTLILFLTDIQKFSAVKRSPAKSTTLLPAAHQSGLHDEAAGWKSQSKRQMTDQFAFLKVHVSDESKTDLFGQNSKHYVLSNSGSAHGGSFILLLSNRDREPGHSVDRNAVLEENTLHSAFKVRVDLKFTFQINSKPKHAATTTLELPSLCPDLNLLVS